MAAHGVPVVMLRAVARGQAELVGMLLDQERHDIRAREGEALHCTVHGAMMRFCQSERDRLPYFPSEQRRWSGQFLFHRHT